MSCVEDKAVICASVQTNHLSAQNNVAVVETKIELDSNADKCNVYDHCLVVHDCNRPVNLFGYNPNAGSKFVCIVDAAVAYTKPETGCVVIFLINQAIEMKSINQHLLCLMLHEWCVEQ